MKLSYDIIFQINNLFLKEFLLKFLIVFNIILMGILYQTNNNLLNLLQVQIHDVTYNDYCYDLKI